MVCGGHCPEGLWDEATAAPLLWSSPLGCFCVVLCIVDASPTLCLSARSRDVKIPETGKIYSFNEGNYQMWDKGVQQYMDSLKKPELWGGKPYSVRRGQGWMIGAQRQWTGVRGQWTGGWGSEHGVVGGHAARGGLLFLFFIFHCRYFTETKPCALYCG